MKTYWARALVLASGLALLLGLGLPLRAIAWETEGDRDREAKKHRGREPEECEKSTFPATGQTTPYTADTLLGPGTPVRDDGTVQAGGRLRYKDNGNGTITDRNTGLMWEKKSYDAGLHDAYQPFHWSLPLIPLRSTIWDWLADVNAEGGKGFAKHKDWRIPNVKELQSIVDYEQLSPTVDPAVDMAFNKGVAAGCITTGPNACSLTAPGSYWSSTTTAGFPEFAWFVEFGFGQVGPTDKTAELFVRAVRGGCVAQAKAKEEEKENEKAKEKEKH